MQPDNGAILKNLRQQTAIALSRAQSSERYNMIRDHWSVKVVMHANKPTVYVWCSNEPILLAFCDELQAQGHKIDPAGGGAIYVER